MPEIYHSGPVAPISAVYDELKIRQTIDEMVSWNRDHWNMSPGKRNKAVMINILGRKRSLIPY